MQLAILTRGLQMLVTGGWLVYSTCSRPIARGGGEPRAARARHRAVPLVDVSHELSLKRNQHDQWRYPMDMVLVDGRGARAAPRAKPPPRPRKGTADREGGGSHAADAEAAAGRHRRPWASTACTGL